MLVYVTKLLNDGQAVLLNPLAEVLGDDPVVDERVNVQLHLLLAHRETLADVIAESQFLVHLSRQPVESARNDTLRRPIQSSV